MENKWGNAALWCCGYVMREGLCLLEQLQDGFGLHRSIARGDAHLTVPVVVDAHFVELEIQLKLLFKGIDGEHRVTRDTIAAHIRSFVAMDVKFHWHI